MRLYKKIIKKLFYNAFPEYREIDLFIKQVERKGGETNETNET